MLALTISLDSAGLSDLKPQKSVFGIDVKRLPRHVGGNGLHCLAARAQHSVILPVPQANVLSTVLLDWLSAALSRYRHTHLSEFVNAQIKRFGTVSLTQQSIKFHWG